MTTTRPEPRLRHPWLARSAPLIVGVDGGPESARALDWAIDHVGDSSRSVELVHAWEWPHVYRWSTSEDEQIERDLAVHGRRVLEQAHARAAAAGLTAVGVRLAHGDGPAVLTGVAGDTGVIVVGTRHLPALPRVVLGSVSTGTVATARCPVIVVNSLGPSTDPRGRVVVGLSGDGDGDGDIDGDVLAFGLAFAARHQLPLLAVLCHPPAPGHRSPAPDPRYQERAESTLAAAVAPGLPVDAHAQAREAHPVDALVAASAGEALLVVGRRRPHHLHPAAIGSVAAGVLHHAVCPVAVVPVSG